MKIDASIRPPDFTPLTLSITFESPDEINGLHGFFNCCPIVDAAEIAIGTPFEPISCGIRDLLSAHPGFDYRKADAAFKRTIDSLKGR